MNSYNTVVPQRTAYSSPAEFLQMVEQELAQASSNAPDDIGLQDLERRVAALRAMGRPGAADDELRKWYSKRLK